MSVKSSAATFLLSFFKLILFKKNSFGFKCFVGLQLVIKKNDKLNIIAM
jgi:hypothetical protein